MSASLMLQCVVAEDQLPLEHDFQTWVGVTLQRLAVSGEIVVRIVDTDESAALNQQYRQKTGATNVLSFPAEAMPDLPAELLAELAEQADRPHLGDLIICAPVVASEAQKQGKPLQAHWAHMIIHGVLHLLGYDHQAPDEAQQMEALEIEILGEMGYPDPYQVTD